MIFARRVRDFSARLPVDWTGMAGKIADTLNDVIPANQMLGEDLARVSRVVGNLGQGAARVQWRTSWARQHTTITSSSGAPRTYLGAVLRRSVHCA
jgi:hypothetical protein